MYETATFDSQKLTACILAALAWPDGNQSLADACQENSGIVCGLVHKILCEYERAVTKRILNSQPDELERLKDSMARERLWSPQQRW